MLTRCFKFSSDLKFFSDHVSTVSLLVSDHVSRWHCMTLMMNNTSAASVFPPDQYPNHEPLHLSPSPPPPTPAMLSLPQKLQQATIVFLGSLDMLRLAGVFKGLCDLALCELWCMINKYNTCASNILVCTLQDVPGNVDAVQVSLFTPVFTHFI